MNAFEAQAHAKMNFKRKGKAAADEAEGPYDVDENDDNYQKASSRDEEDLYANADNQFANADDVKYSQEGFAVDQRKQ